MAQTNAKTGLKPEAQIVIDALAYGPYGIGRLDGKAVMIPDTAPGDKIIARVVESKERYAVGEVIDSSNLRRSGKRRLAPTSAAAAAAAGNICVTKHS